MSDPATFERDPDGVCRFTLARPDAMNALNREMVETIAGAASVASWLRIGWYS